MKIFTAKDITKRFGAVEVLKGVSLDFYPGTVTALVGDNGAGKSTFLKILSGLFNPDYGKVLCGEVDLSNAPVDIHRRYGIEMVYQDLALAKQQSIATNLFIGREKTYSGGFLNRREMNEAGTAVLSRLGIQIPNLNKLVGVLSGGQQQAIAIARALLFDPKVLLLDEPTAALAVREVEKVLEIIKLQRTEGRIVILVSHRLNDVLAVADRIVVLKQGSILTDDQASSVTLSDIVERIVS